MMVKKQFGKILKISAVFVLVFAWMFSGWPQILDFPPEVREAKAGTEDLHASGAGTSNDWLGVDSTNLAGNDNDTTKATGTSKNDFLYATIANTSTCSGTVTKVTAKIYAYSSTNGMTQAIGMYDGVNFIYDGQEQPSLDSGAYTLHTFESLTNPSGGAWTCGIVDSLEIIVDPNKSGAPTGDWRVTELWITVDYTPTSTLSTGTDPGATTIAPGPTETTVNEFVITTSSGTETITHVTVNLSTANGIARLNITDSGDVEKGFTTSPSNGSNQISVTMSAGGGTTFKVRVIPETHALMPPVPGAEYAITAPVTSWTGTSGYAHDGSDDNPNALTIDNLSANNATLTSGSAGDEQVTLNWTTSDSSDFNTTSGSVIYRWTASSVGSEVPAEGSTATIGAANGTAITACVVSSALSASLSKIDGSGGSAECTTDALTNDIDYSYRVFQKDLNGNYDAGYTFDGSPFTPTGAAAPTLSFSIAGVVDYAITFGDLNVSAPRWAGDSAGSNSEGAAHTLTAATNSSSGYAITVKGDTLKYSTYEITACGPSAVSVAAGGSKQFGIRITSAGDNCAGSQVAPYNGAANMYGYNATASAEDEIVSCSSASTTTTYSMHYAANISTLTEAGTYNATLTFICTGNF